MSVSRTPISILRHTGAGGFSRRYPLWLCDVWGVVHDGLAAYPQAVDALTRHRANGGIVLLLTNAPRPAASVERQLKALKVGRDVYDGIVSSGDVTRALVMRHQGETIFFLGPERDRPVLDGLGAILGPLEKASVMVCTGLIDDDTERPEDYDPMLREMRDRKLDMICANPDKVVRKGDRLLPCAGALAERYAALGGVVHMAGKPYAPIYEEALAHAARIAGRDFSRGEALAIGDGLHTDADGAARNGFAMLFIAGGIHEAELAGADTATAVRRAVPGLDLAGVLPALVW